MFRRTIVWLLAALAASVFLSHRTAEAGKPAPPPTGPSYSLYWVASTSVYWDPRGGDEGDWVPETIKWSQPRGINDAGDVVGLACWDARDGGPDPDGSGENWEVFLYTAADGRTQNLNDIVGAALPDNWRLIDAGDINNARVIVGTAEYRYEHLEEVWDEVAQEWVLKLLVDQDYGVFRYNPNPPEGSSALEILGSTPDYYWDMATSINDAGDMVMHKFIGLGGYPYIYTLGGAFIPLPAPAGNSGYWKGTAIGNRGLISDPITSQVAGNARIGDFVNAVRYTPGVGTVPLGWLKNPGPSRWGNGNDINDSGQVVGTSTTGTTVHAFRYTDGVMKDLGALGKSRTYGYGINNCGDCVGDALDSGSAFLYTDTNGMVDLKAAIVNFAAWPQYAQMRLQARRINDDNGPDSTFRRCILGSLGGDRGQACLLKRLP
jgi:probable HAF family extracellular repeat protein